MQRWIQKAKGLLKEEGTKYVKGRWEQDIKAVMFSLLLCGVSNISTSNVD